MTLGCLAPYRRLGIGSTMVRHVMDIVEKDGNFDSVFLHVQVNSSWNYRIFTVFFKL
jgi:ribosomal protein S18 acetylase RimI-like enzyme